MARRARRRRRFVYDASGNLVFDGLHWCRSDAWGRLCLSASAPSSPTFDDGSTTFAHKGRLLSTPADPEDSIIHFTYERPRPAGRQAVAVAAGGRQDVNGDLHNGVRRTQEIWREPAEGNGAESGQNQDEEGGGDPKYVDSTEREYVHSPGYVDEFVCEIDTGGTPDTFWWVLQDPNYNVVALVSDGDGSLSRGEVARQYSWSPYGQLLRADIYDTSAPMSRLGHQGLFHDRLDADILSEPMAAFARQAVQNRNRTLLPWLGRFAQRDPHATGLILVTEPMYYGASGYELYDAASIEALFTDGQSLYAYLGSNPPNAQDPLGLFEFSTTNVLASSGLQAMLGAIIGGTVNSVTGNGSFAQGAIAGGIAGGLGGLGAAAVNSAFAASASGLVGTIAVHMAVGATDGAIAGFSESYYHTGDLGVSMANALWGAALGGATGGLLSTPSIRYLFVPAKARTTLAFLRSHNYTPPKNYRGGKPWDNVRGDLPQGRYKEFDVDPKIKGSPRNRDRIVIDMNSGRAYYTPDHYDSFIPMID